MYVSLFDLKDLCLWGWILNAFPFHFLVLSLEGLVYALFSACTLSWLAPSAPDASQKTITSLEAYGVMQFTCMVT